MSSNIFPDPDGGAIEGNGMLVGYQVTLACSIAAYAFVVTYLILLVMKYIPGIKFTMEDAHMKNGMDMEEMGEGYIKHSLILLVAYAYANGRESIISFSKSAKSVRSLKIGVENIPEVPSIPTSPNSAKDNSAKEAADEATTENEPVNEKAGAEKEAVPLEVTANDEKAASEAEEEIHESIEAIDNSVDDVTGSKY